MEPRLDAVLASFGRGCSSSGWNGPAWWKVWDIVLAGLFCVMSLYISWLYRAGRDRPRAAPASEAG